MTTEERTTEKRYLTTKEFKRKVENLGFVTNDKNTRHVIIYDSNGTKVAYVSRYERYAFDTAFFAFINLTDFNQKSLFNLLVDYASTPLDERKKDRK